jgi:hypothetical protein
VPVHTASGPWKVKIHSGLAFQIGPRLAGAVLGKPTFFPAA